MNHILENSQAMLDGWRGTLLLISVVWFYFPFPWWRTMLGGSGKKCLYSGRHVRGNSSFSNFPRYHPFCILLSSISDCRRDGCSCPQLGTSAVSAASLSPVCCIIKCFHCSGGKESSRAVFTCWGGWIVVEMWHFPPWCFSSGWSLGIESTLLVRVYIMRKEILIPAHQPGEMGKRCT